MSTVPLEQAKPGDLALCRSAGIVGMAIRLGQRLRVPRAFCTWNHVAILSEKDGDGWWVIEATGRGVKRNPLDAPGRHDYVIVDTAVDEAHRSQVVAFARSQLSDPYGWLTIAAIVLDLLTPSRLDLRRDGTWICSALGARAVEHGGRYFDRINPFQAMPAQLAQLYEAS